MKLRDLVHMSSAIVYYCFKSHHAKPLYTTPIVVIERRVEAEEEMPPTTCTQRSRTTASNSSFFIFFVIFDYTGIRCNNVQSFCDLHLVFLLTRNDGLRIRGVGGVSAWFSREQWNRSAFAVRHTSGSIVRTRRRPEGNRQKITV